MGFLLQCLYNAFWLLLNLTCGYFLLRLSEPFVRFRKERLWRAALLLLFAGSSGMVIWVGDPNMLYTLPVFLVLFLLCTRGNRVGRLAMCLVFFCLIMSVCAILDTYLYFLAQYDILTRLLRPLVFGALYLLLRRQLPEGQAELSPRLWQLILGLAAMPFCALAAVVLLTYQKYDSAEVYTLSMNQGMVVLPFVLLTAVMLLRAVLVLADHQRLERSAQLSSLREVYYQGLQREQAQVRTLRHDLRNHLTVLDGLLRQGETFRAMDYLSQLEAAPALQTTRCLCGNQTANAVLAAKAEQMERMGLQGEFQVSLPAELPVADVDLCALLGNALDNAMEAAAKAEDKRILVQCRVERGMLMLRVVNALAGDERPGLATTKEDPTRHGFGIPGMAEIARRYGGYLEAGGAGGKFTLVACLPL